MLAACVESVFDLLKGLGREEDVGEEVSVAPAAIFLTSQHCIFLVPMLNLPLHSLNTGLLAVAIVSGVGLVPFPQAGTILVVSPPFMIDFLLQLDVQEMLLGDFGESLHVLISEAGSIVEPIGLHGFLKVKFVPHPHSQ